MQEQTKAHSEKEHPQPGPNVTVTVDTKPKVVHRRSWIVAEFKEEVGVDETRELDQVIDGEFKPLADKDRITIKGGEIFVSHVPKGGSS